MRTFMLGWEFPPFISGGLGTACYGLTRAMDRLGMQVVFVLPQGNPLYIGFIHRSGDTDTSSYRFHSVRRCHIVSQMGPYGRIKSGEDNRCTETTSSHGSHKSHPGGLSYEGDMKQQVADYTRRIIELGLRHDFDLVHGHDWMTYPAAVQVSRYRHTPLVVHVHSTEFDRCGEHADPWICDMEYQGVQSAHRVITVSDYTRRIVVERYAVPRRKVEVVYNGIEEPDSAWTPAVRGLAKTEPTVLFLGRITMQKGPEYFLMAARLVLERYPNVRFIMAGDGDKFCASVKLAADMGIGDRVLFTKFLRGEAVHRAYALADVYVMPSVSEPFGLTALEALQHRVPIIISKQSGVAECLHAALKVDFWDVRDMASKICAVLQHEPLSRELREEGSLQVKMFTWDKAALTIKHIYEQLLATTVN